MKKNLNINELVSLFGIINIRSFDYLKPKYGKNVKLCYMDTDSFIVYVKTEDIYKYIAKDVEKRFDTSNFETDKPLPKEKNKKLD